MNLIPMGDYYVWHCDWCDSTNHTLWSRVDDDGLACAACHHRLVPPRGQVPIQRHPAQRMRQPDFTGIAC